MSLELVKSIVSNYAHLVSDVKLVKVICRQAAHSEPKACFNNAYRAMSAPDDLYVLGFVLVQGVPIEHAWIKSGGRYIDVTLEPSGFEYVSVVEMPFQVLLEITEANRYCPPDIFDVNRFLRSSK